MGYFVQSVDINMIAKEEAHHLESNSPKKVAITYDFRETALAVTGDAAQIRQVIANLLANATEAMSKKPGAITLRSGVMDGDRTYLEQTRLGSKLPEGRYAYLEISDTGCGMDMETQSKIFNPFFSTKHASRGLGLAVVLGILRKHRGTIRLESKPEEGTTFRILFPRMDNDGFKPAQNPRAPTTLQGQRTILVIDDEKTVLNVTKLMLERYGYTVLIANDGSEGINIFRSHANDVDLILLDLTMPDMDGEETFHKIYSIRQDIKIILTSGFHNLAVTQRLRQAGLAGFMQKPYNPQELLEALRGAMVES